jgi:hypothetical protein
VPISRLLLLFFVFLLCGPSDDDLKCKFQIFKDTQSDQTGQRPTPRTLRLGLHRKKGTSTKAARTTSTNEELRWPNDNGHCVWSNITKATNAGKKAQCWGKTQRIAKSSRSINIINNCSTQKPTFFTMSIQQDVGRQVSIK